MSRNPKFDALIEEIKKLHEGKNSDYALDSDPLSNLRRCEAFGIPAFKGVLVRLTDKWSRIEQLAMGKTPRHESLRDSLIDNAVYSLLAVMLLDERIEMAVQFSNMHGTSAPCALPVCLNNEIGIPVNVP
jgi:hypothetical protein